MIFYIYHKNKINSMKDTLKGYILLAFKISIILIAIGDVFSLLPESLDIFDKILTSIILLWLWFGIKPSRLLFGNYNRLLDIIMITGFYILSLDTYTTAAAKIEYQAPYVTEIFHGFGIETVTSFFNWILYNLQSSYTATKISIFSLQAGSAILIALAIYIATKHKPNKDSITGCIFSFFSKKDNSWNRFSSSRIFIPLRFIFSFLLMLSFFLFVVNLINQWFIVSIDKSIFIIGVLFAVKDIENTKSKTLNKIGQFDEMLIKNITNLFTKRDKFYLGVGIILIFHILSDLATFFFPYLLNLSKEAFYFDSLGRELLHQSFYHHLTTETISGIQIFSFPLIYMMVAIGIVSMMLFLIICSFLMLYEKNLKQIISKKSSSIPIVIAFISILVYFAAPMISQQAIIPTEDIYTNAEGLIGVDFLTAKMSEVIIMEPTALAFCAIILSATLLFVFGQRINKFLGVIIYVASISFFANYIGNYLLSSANYSTEIIKYLYSSGDYLIATIIAIMMLLSIIFYTLGFILFAYKSSRYIIEHMKDDLQDNRLIIIWAGLIILISMILVSLGKLEILTSVITGSFIFALAFYNECKGTDENHDDFVLAINFLIFSFLIVNILSYITTSLFEVEKTVMYFVNQSFILISAIYFIQFFRLKIKISLPKTKKILKVAYIGIIAGLFFYLLNEPVETFFNGNILLILLFTFMIATSEELIFRFFIFKISEKVFSYHQSQIIQSTIFTLIHFMNIKIIWYHFKYHSEIFIFDFPVLFLLYFTGLFVFGYVMGIIAHGKDKNLEKNIKYAILAHWITNFILILMTMYF